jgi:Domain of unknown function (DUF4384)
MREYFMSLRTFNKRNLALLLGLCFFWTIGLGIAALAAYQQDEETRLIDEAFLSKRPKKSTNKPVVAYRPLRKNPKTARVRPQKFDSNSLVGVTLWRLQAAKSEDSAETRIFEYENQEKIADLAAERIDISKPVPLGTRIRFGVEVPRDGFLYVVDREQYADGSYGDPYLIFPVADINDGDNTLTAGRLMEIPPQSTTYKPFVKLTKRRADLVAESLTILVTNKPLDVVLGIGNRPTVLSSELFASWERKYAGSAEGYITEQGLGKTYSKEEKQAGTSKQEVLGQEANPPQAIYRVSPKIAKTAKPTDGIMFTVPIKIAQ